MKDVSVMAMKNVVEVVIAGKVYKISGYESAEYLHQVSVYINEKLAEFQKMDGYRKQNADQKQLMLNMNLADDFFKAKRQADKLSAELEKKEREMYGIRHDLVDAQLALEKQDSQNREWEEKLAAQEKEYEERLEKSEVQRKENMERLENQRKAFEKERQEMKKTAENLKKALENQKKLLEEQKQATQKKLEEQNQAAQKRFSEQKRTYDSEIERLQRELQTLQRKVGRVY